MMLTSQFAPIRGIWAGFCASARCANRRTVHEGPIPIDLVPCLKLCKQVFEKALPNPCFVPSTKIASTGLSAREVGGRREPAPWDTRAENEQNTGKHSTWLSRLPARELHMPAFLQLRDP